MPRRWQRAQWPSCAAWVWPSFPITCGSCAKRDLLKSASSAASLAATIRLSELNGQTPAPSDADIAAALQPLAERYVRLNVLGNLGGAVKPEDITVTLAIDSDAGTVAVTATAPLGITLLESFHGSPGPGSLTVGSGAEQMHEAVWAILAIDVSYSMTRDLSGTYLVASPNRRIDIVQAAAREFVDVLGPDASKDVAIGVVPWERRAYIRLPPRQVEMPSCRQLMGSSRTAARPGHPQAWRKAGHSSRTPRTARARPSCC